MEQIPTEEMTAVQEIIHHL